MRFLFCFIVLLGFCAAMTKDVIALAVEIKETGKASSSVQELSVVDVPLGDVRILALSFDDSTLAASVGGDVHFFSVNSLLADKVKLIWFSHFLMFWTRFILLYFIFHWTWISKFHYLAIRTLNSKFRSNSGPIAS